ncbi:MAG: alpha/beta hydrolase [Bacteroidota bacterium]
MKIVFRALILIVVLLIGGFFLGPSPEPPAVSKELPAVPAQLTSLETWIGEQEAKAPVKPDNEAMIVWADSTPQKTQYAVVYLHGFSASREEGGDIARAFADRYGCNLFLARLHEHGLVSEEPLLNYRADSVYATAQEALAIGKQLGEQVILMSTSTGGTLSLMLGEDPAIAAHILYSPNIQINNPAAGMLSGPWGFQIARQVTGSDYNEWEGDAYSNKYWFNKYRIEAMVELQNLLDYGMNPATFGAVKAPVYLAYYYKDEENQDPTVMVSAMLEMFDQLGTPAEVKRKEAFPTAGVHVICNPEKSEAYEEVKTGTFSFAEEILQLTAAPQSTEGDGEMAM